ncbi:hypothetical protein [Vulcanisaeta sp. JCM 16161]|uniref:hypothetical protein n=1 Tax=Vulcanisaeta sp. JCM 16161 TaxID=1295372 RepID=UPI000A8E735D|nr:hypothetical protein [Vulcanisaeta sp. JCM 16161]
MQRLRCEASNDELLRTMMIIEELSPYWGLIGIKIEDVGRDCAVGFVEIGRKHLQILARYTAGSTRHWPTR